MDRAYFFDGQSIGADDLNSGIDRLASNIKNRTIDFFSKGVIGTRNASFVQNDVNNKIKILPFVAYTTNGERIDMYTSIGGLALDISDETADILQKYRLRQQGSLTPENFGWEVNETYHIYINYIEKGGKAKEQISTGLFFPTRVYSGFEFYAIPQSVEIDINTTNMVRLCAVVYDGTITTVLTPGYLQFSSIDANKIYTSVNPSQPANYNPRTAPVSMEAHVMCLGSGSPSVTNPHGLTPSDLGFDEVSVQTHEKRMHSAGLSGNILARSSTNSALYTKPNVRDGQFDNLVLYNLSQDEYIHSNGYWLSSLRKLTNTGTEETYVDITQASMFIQFTYDNAGTQTPLPRGAYTIGVQSTTGAIVIGSDIDNAENYTLNITADTLGNDVITAIQLLSQDAYAAEDVFSIAQFVWDYDSDNPYNKPVTTIIGYTRSNFTSKEDLRVFGCTNALDLTTSKEVDNSDSLTLPYTVVVNKLKLENGAVFDGTTTELPNGYVRGFSLTYIAHNIITVNPGVCRDSNNIYDIRLTQPITKTIDTAWAVGGTYASPVGGLSNQDIYLSAPSLTSDHTSLYIFAIANSVGTVDVAIDTDITGANIRNGEDTQYFPYIRRIGALYISETFGTTGKITLPYRTVPEGNGLWVYYDAPLELTASMFNTDGVWTRCGIPAGDLNTYNVFKSKFNASNFSEVIQFYSNFEIGKMYISGSTVFDIHIADQSLCTSNSPRFSFGSQHIYCLGYYDARNS